MVPCVAYMEQKGCDGAGASNEEEEKKVNGDGDGGGGRLTNLDASSQRVTLSIT